MPTPMPPSVLQKAGRQSVSAPKKEQQTPEARLDALTSLRFIAAAMIVVSHTAGYFYLDPHEVIKNLPLAQGVSFFFILSGFILTHVYQDLSGFKSTLHFLSARIARVYPVYIVTAILTYAILPASMIAKDPVGMLQTAVTQLCMVHGWIPERFFYFSVNSPSWSISTEFFFYLAFPILVLNIRKNWLTKLCLLTLLPVSLIIASHILHLPTLGEAEQVSTHGLLYINPLSRIFEFYLGMLTCLLVSRIKLREPDRVVTTFVEVAAIAVIVGVIMNIEPLMFRCGLTNAFPTLSLYLKYCGNTFGYVLLIAAVSLERGFIARILRAAPLVFLGEVSYSVYLIHFPLFAWFNNNHALFATTARILRYGIYWASLLALSTLSFMFLEKPARKFLRRVFTNWIGGTGASA
ncbi:MAG TPA: acyltransferase [Oculatellaceae cyanobacterium]